jgi:type II secretory pathway pseudopilin PulG
VLLIATTLAGIAVPSYLNQRDKALDATAKATARAAQAAAIDVAAGNEGRFNGPGGVTVSNLRRVDRSLAGVELTVLWVRSDGYGVRVESETGNTFDITQYPEARADLTCATADSAGCPADGTWD